MGTPQSNFKSLKKNPELGKTASGKSANKVEVYTDPDLVGNTVKVDWKFNDDNTITGVAMRAAPDATTRDIELHQHTARVMSRYGGVLGRIRVAFAKIAKVLGIKGHPRPGSKAWEAQHEIYKLKQINYDLSERIKTANPTEASQLEAQLVNIQSQLQEHIQTFKREDDSDGVGYVAAEGYDLYKANHDTSDNIRKRKDVQNNAQIINTQKGTKEDPKIIPPELGMPSLVETRRVPGAEIEKPRSMTRYKIGATNVTVKQGPGIRYNRYVALGRASKYSAIRKQTIKKIMKETGYDDSDIAYAWRDKIKGKPLPEDLQKYEGQIDRLTMLMFGSESIRNTGNIVYAPMTLDLIASDKDPMTWREALDGYEPDQEDNYTPTQQRLGDRGAFPMSMTDAQISALYLEAQRKGKDPVEYLLEERWQRLPKEKQTPEEHKKIHKQITNKIKNDKIEQKAEELKKREIELTNALLINAKEINISDLDLMSEKQAAQIIEQGTLDFYLNRKRLEDNKP